MSRLASILKLARETLTKKEQWAIDDALYGARGYDYIDYILADLGFSRGPRFGKKKFHLRRGGEPIGNAYLSGDYDGMRVIPEAPPEEVEEPKPHIPWDAYHSSGALYEDWERENER